MTTEFVLDADSQEFGRVWEHLARDGHVAPPTVREVIHVNALWLEAGRPGKFGDPVGSMTDFIVAHAKGTAEVR